MNTLIFSINIDKYVTERKKYFKEARNLIINNHKKYATFCNSDYVLITNIEEDFVDRFKKYSNHDIINYYKFHLLEQFCSDYDRVLYIDFDVIVNRYRNIFDAFKEKFVIRGIPVTKEMYHEEKLKGELGARIRGDTEYVYYNTGLMLSDQKLCNQLNFFKNINETLEYLEVVNNFSNEIQFGYRAIHVDKHLLGENSEWLNLPSTVEDYKENVVMHHISNKKRLKYFLSKSFI